MHRYILHIIVLLFTVFNVTAQVSFEARVSKKSMGLNERLRVDFIMNKNGDNFTAPNFSDFRVVGGPNQSISNSWVNGKRSFSKTFTYFLSPKKKGAATLKAATVKIEGKVYRTTAVKITISESVATPRDPHSPEYLIDDNLHLVTEVSNPRPYLNEAITVVYKLYFRSPLKISDAREIESPKFQDFWSHIIKIPQLQVQNATFRGEDYKMVIWRKTVLYPQKTGKLTLEPLSLNVVIGLPSNQRDFFGGRIVQQTSRSITAEKRFINVKRLPEKGKPANFFGAVGQFDFDLILSKNALKASESFELKVKAIGRGNLKLFTLPKLSLPNTLEVYEPEHSEEVKTSLGGMKGSIEDKYTVVPRFQGKYPISPVSFSFFDPKKEEYFTLMSQEHIVEVYDGPIAGKTANKNNSTLNQLVSNENKSFRFIKLIPNLRPIEQLVFLGSKEFYLMIVTPFSLLLMFYFLLQLKIKRYGDVDRLKLKTANKLAKKYLGSAKKNLKNKIPFYDALERALHNYLKAKLSIETFDFNKGKIRQLLKEKSLSPGDIDSFVNLLENCEIARYSPATDAKMQQDFDQALNVIATIDRKL